MFISEIQNPEIKHLETKNLERQAESPPNARQEGVQTFSLIEMIQKNNQEDFDRLLNLKIDPLGKMFIDEVDDIGDSPLHWAAILGHIHFIAPLITAGADVNKLNNEHQTSVYVAAQNGHAEAIKALEAAGADVDTSSYGATPVWIAAYNGHVAAITALKNVGAAIDTPTPINGKTPVYIAAEMGHAAAITALKVAGADVDRPDKGGCTPVFVAARKGNSEAIVALHEARANVNTPDNDGKTPILIAAYYGHAAAIIALGAAGANVDMPIDEHGHTPVFLAAANGHSTAITALKAAGANVDMPEKISGVTPVLIAAAKGHAAAITALGAAGANMNTPGKDGRTPIGVAASYGEVVAIIALLEAGADASVNESVGTPLEQAKKGKDPRCPEVVRLLESHLKKYPKCIKAVTTSVTPSATSVTFHTRRPSIKLNLTDKKEEQEKIRYVLEELRTFFLEEREEGEKTENHVIYNEYLKKVSNGAQLIYKQKQSRHVLYINGKPLEGTDIAVQEISKMIDVLAVANVPKKPMVSSPHQPVHISAQTLQVASPVAVLVQKPNVPENNPSFTVLHQFHQVAKPFPKVSASDSKELEEFLRLVAEGEQDKAENMLKINPALALVPGDVIDLSKRTFNGITAFQYAVWALDWHMWTMIKKHLPPEEAQLQAQGFETGPWVKAHGVHANLNTLIQAYQTTLDLYYARKYTEGNTVWVQQVGGAQRLLPAHVINEYCHPTRPSHTLPNFKDTTALPRSRTIAEGEWFTASYNGGKLGEKFACRRGGVGVPSAAGAGLAGRLLEFGVVNIGDDWMLQVDHKNVISLTSARTAQREELIAELRSLPLALTNVHQKPPASTQLNNMISMSLNVSQVASPGIAPKPNPPDMLTQFNQVAKPFPTVSVNGSKELEEFLKLVAEGEQDKAEAMLKSNPNLALVLGDVTDLSKRTFTGITAFQYAVWALDWHMWSMIRKYLPDEAAIEQAQVFETGAWVKIHGVHFNLNILIKAYQAIVDLYRASPSIDFGTIWVEKVGGAQLLLPAHVINEYCHPTRPFYPPPNFKDAAPLPRTRSVDNGEWFSAVYNGGKLGDKFSAFRGANHMCFCSRGPNCLISGVDKKSKSHYDLEGVLELASVRIAQRNELITEFRTKHVQRKAG